MSDGSGMIVVIGRGHSGTRVIAHTLYSQRGFHGHYHQPLGGQGSGAENVRGLQGPWPGRCNGGEVWTGDFSALHQGPVAAEFVSLVESYLEDLLGCDGPRGWKLPETTLVFPWIVRLFPRARYIYWIRDPRDCIIGPHKTDDLRDFGIACPHPESERERRAISWKYQYDLVRSTPRPGHWLTLRFEDFVLRQGRVPWSGWRIFSG